MVKRFMNDESGAASVLVIFMMLVLVTLGAYSISSANVNYAFSSRALGWKDAYYDCDSRAEMFLMDADAALAKAEKETVEAITLRNAHISEEDAGQSTGTLYNQNVLKEISLLSDKYNVEIKEDDLSISTVISSNSGSQIKVKIAALPFRYSFESAGNGVWAVLSGKSGRFAVLEWKQAQKADAGSTAQESLWDGIIH